MRKNFLVVAILFLLVVKVFSAVPKPFSGRGSAVVEFYLDITEDIGIFDKGIYTKVVMITVKDLSTGQAKLVYPNSNGLITLYNYEPGKYEITGFEIRKLSNSDNYYYKKEFEDKIKFTIKKDGITFAGSIVVTMTKASQEGYFYVDYIINQTQEMYKTLRKKFSKEDKDGLYKKIKKYKIVKEDPSLAGIPEGSIIYEYDKGYFVKVGDAKWEQRIKFKKDVVIFEQFKQDDDYYYLKNDERQLSLAVPAADEGYLKIYHNKKWENVFMLTKKEKSEESK